MKVSNCEEIFANFPLSGTFSINLRLKMKRSGVTQSQSRLLFNNATAAGVKVVLAQARARRPGLKRQLTVSEAQGRAFQGL